MTATTPVGFDPAPKFIEKTRTYTAGATILGGQIVAFATTGVSETVHPATTSLGRPVGVAAYGASTGEAVMVYGDGCEVKIELSADTGTADAGDTIAVSTVAGTGITFDAAIAAHDSEYAGIWPIGMATEDIAAGAATVGGKGYVILNMTPIWTASS